MAAPKLPDFDFGDIFSAIPPLDLSDVRLLAPSLGQRNFREAQAQPPTLASDAALTLQEERNATPPLEAFAGSRGCDALFDHLENLENEK